MSSHPLSDDFIGQRQRRIANLDELTKRGITCYPAQSKKDADHATIHAEYESRKGETLTLAGRIMKWRAMGKLIFADIVDQTGRIQICIRKDAYPSEESNSNPPRHGGADQAPNNDDNAAVIASDAKDVAWQSRPNQTLTWDELKFVDLGDFIQVTGLLERTQAGEVTVFANEIMLLSKALRPYPNQIEDKDERYRRRYVDMVLHPKVREVMKRKATFWQTIRKTLVDRGFTEIFLPVLEHTTGGADAKPFVTHHNTLDEDLYLRISLELYSKRAIGAGFEKVFAIGPVFRNEGMSDEHANEFNHVEWYWAYADYRDQMELTKQVIIETAQAVYGKTKFTTRGHSFDLADTWKEIDYTQVLKDTYGIDIFADSDEQIAKVALSHGVELEGGAANRQRMIDSLWKLVRKTISGPAFLIHEPAFMSPLAKAKTDNPLVTERFHIILAGTEAANGYSEINDPQYQLQQFRDQQKMRDGGDAEAQMLDIDFIEMLEYGMPPTTGLGFSERLFWFFEDITAREGAMFPVLRNEVDALTRKIYPFLEMQKVSSKSENMAPSVPKISSNTIPDPVIPAKAGIPQPANHALHITREQTLDTKTPQTADSTVEKFLIFDFDGVLADTADELHEALITHGFAKDHDSALLERIKYFSRKPPHSRGTPMTEDARQNMLNLVKYTSDYIIRKGFGMFDDFIHQVSLVKNKKVAIVSSNSRRSIEYKREALAVLAPTHILTYDDSASKEEKIERICKAWGVTPKDVYYFTDTLADVYELEELVDKSHIIGCGWGFLGEMWLKKELPDKQILKRYSDVHSLVFNPISTKQLHDGISSPTPHLLTRDQALALIDEHIKNPGLRKHCLAVEAAMGTLHDHFATNHPKLIEGSYKDTWTLAGLLHDADWEECREMPTQHTLKTLTWLRGIGVEHNELIDAILTHAHHVTSYRQPSSPLEWSLYCCDELTGLIVANALILPSKKLADVTVESVIKKMGSKSFAAAIDREGIKMCEEKLGIKLEEFVGIVLKGMQSASASLGL